MRLTSIFRLDEAPNPAHSKFYSGPLNGQTIVDFVFFTRPQINSKYGNKKDALVRALDSVITGTDLNRDANGAAQATVKTLGLSGYEAEDVGMTFHSAAADWHYRSGGN